MARSRPAGASPRSGAGGSRAAARGSLNAAAGGHLIAVVGRRPTMSTVLLRMSTLFLRTLRDDPADAEVPSHRLLVRAGYIRRSAPGVLSWLPRGYRVFRIVERVVREEMDAMGAQEVPFPALMTREPYEATGSWTEYCKILFPLVARKGARSLPGTTREDMFSLLVNDM